MSAGCIFCKIVAGEIPATIVKRTDGALAFKDLSPQAPTHLLVIPTTHVGTLNDTKDGKMLGDLLAFARDVAREAGIATKGYRVVLNTNQTAGKPFFTCICTCWAVGRCIGRPVDPAGIAG